MKFYLQIVAFIALIQSSYAHSAIDQQQVFQLLSAFNQTIENSQELSLVFHYSLETSEGIQSQTLKYYKSGEKTFTVHNGGEALIMDGLFIGVSHDVEALIIQEYKPNMQQLSLVNQLSQPVMSLQGIVEEFKVIHQTDTSARVQFVVDTLDVYSMFLTIDLRTGCPLEIAFAESKKEGRVEHVIQCVQFKQDVDTPVQFFNLERYVRKDKDGQFSLTPKYQNYELITAL